MSSSLSASPVRQPATRSQKAGTSRDAETPALSRREIQRRETHRALITAAMTLLAAKGFEETTTDEIAIVAGVSRRTLFRYFPTKADIVTAWTQQMTDVRRVTVNACADGTPPQDMIRIALETVVPHIAKTQAESYAFVYLIERTPALLPVSLRKYAQWEESLASALLLRFPDMPDGRLAFRIAARSGVAAFRTAVDEWIRLKGRQPLIPIMQTVMTLQIKLFTFGTTASIQTD